jgi:predicted O-methyltransferase YrrM
MEFWAAFLRRFEARTVAELGVFRGAFAAHMLANCPALETYYMIDPWRHLDDWNKPANRDDRTFQEIFADAMRRTREHERRRVVLRGRTTEVIDQVADASLDVAYVDADHTLRGVMIDLVSIYPKVRPGGWIGGDDFAPSIWQHGSAYEPTLVFPLAVHFAEAVRARIYGLPRNQFLIEKRPDRGFTFVDLTGTYGDVSLRAQLEAARKHSPASQSPGRAKRLVNTALKRARS